MFKKKPIYIAGLIFFTLLLIADLVVFFMVPTGGGRGDMPNFGGGSFGDFGGQMPDIGDFDFGDFGGQMPDMGGSGFGGQRPGGSQMGSSQNNLFTGIRNAFWPILIICILGDALCIFMLVRISRHEETEEMTEAEDDLHRIKRTNTVLAVVAGVLVVAVVLTSLPNGNTGGGMAAEMSVEQATVELTDIITVFSGSGTLQSSSALEMQIPAGVSILSYAAQKGDTVEAGDVLAYVDKISVKKTIYEVQALLDNLDAELFHVQGNTLEDTIVSQTSGRIKAIYVAAGDSVAAGMYENGALLLISLGGSMTVTLESDAEVSVGQNLTVTASDGTQVEGKVQQADGGKITVTTTDDGPAHGDTVSVETEEGVTLGSGILEVSSPLKIMGYAGTVSSIQVSVGDMVSSGDTLLKLSNTEDLARYQQLLQNRESLTDILAQLSTLYQEGAVKAQAGGILTRISVDSTAAVTASTGGSFGNQPGQEVSYTVEMSTFCAITPAEMMTIDISVDELDILTLAAGQEASITMDALPGQSFTGTVQKINTTGTNDGGSTKYTVKMEVPRTEQMLSGMNASVRIEVSSLENVLTVPAAAVFEDGNRCYVYTALDKNGGPANPVDVVTGSSDGQVIEILEGLNSGDTVYYSYADSITFQFNR